jgi:hypothetical protein
LKRNKDGVPAVTIAGVLDINGTANPADVPAVLGLQMPYPVSSSGVDAAPVTNGSGNVANAVATATLAAAAGKTTYISGAGATAAGVVNPTITGVIGGTKTYTQTVVAGATLANPILDVQFCPPIPASAVNTAIAVSCPALGAGNTNNTVNAYGFQL